MPGGGEDRLDVRHPGLHRARAGEHLGHEDEVLAELDADDAHAGDQAVVHDLERGRPGRQRLDGQASTVSSSPSMSAAAIACISGLAAANSPMSRSRSSGTLDELVDLFAEGVVRDVGQLRHRFLGSGAGGCINLIGRRARATVPPESCKDHSAAGIQRLPVIACKTFADYPRLFVGLERLWWWTDGRTFAADPYKSEALGDVKGE